ncbi:protein-disulfide reductase DsbD [Celerinatantimonas diazotrophica]|uniref:Thiol:disulfide interchange protein DsbD n=1 Tax=Celerinatantimonas diazotrophica TaxID=412034 RepID=A0A4R1JA48_9GAMM|nr:protein-disulfide reductase DsbD [Celerinatantimonas diazotrophica]TCK47334.1 thiol:disulfide interchange protein DsbD [Celerinatantimonas diazotrophica]CAG9295050.1 Thiol:disulfide interchange protein DsbD [Celerinatantimonas diazotrophica]
MRTASLRFALLRWLLGICLVLSVFPSQAQVLNVSQAFSLQASYAHGQLQLNWHIQPGYYLYRDRIHLISDSAALKSFYKPPGVMHHDPIFGDTRIYTSNVTLLADVELGSRPTTSIRLSFQGCSQSGFCYPPTTRIIDIHANHVAIHDASVHSIDTASWSASPAPAPAPSSAWHAGPWMLLSSFGFGLLLAFTPCVLPMLPIITGIIIGQRKRTTLQSVLLGVIYVQGMALTYTLLGIIIAYVGVKMQIYLQNPWVLGLMSAILVGLALSMFGLFELQLPSAAQTRLQQWQGHLTQGSYLGVMLMGALSGVICSPCVSAPTAGMLVYIAQSGSVLMGALTLYLFALGMGLPLIAVAWLGKKVLPKAGIWMLRVRQLGGFLMLSAALLLVSRVLDDVLSDLLWLLLAGVLLVWLGYLLFCRVIGRRYALVSCVLLAFLLVVAGEQIFHYRQTVRQAQQPLAFVSVDSLTQLQTQLRQAKQKHQPVLVDYFANWCVACKEFEQDTLNKPQIRQQLAQFKLLRVDVSRYLPRQQDILSHYRVLGLPTLDLYDANGSYRPELRVSGIISTAQFAKRLVDVSSSKQL